MNTKPKYGKYKTEYKKKMENSTYRKPYFSHRFENIDFKNTFKLSPIQKLILNWYVNLFETIINY